MQFLQKLSKPTSENGSGSGNILNSEKEKIYLSSGNVVITNKRKLLWTVLGSCVSVIFHSKDFNITTMCHAQLPQRNHTSTCRDSCPKPCYSSKADDGKNDFLYMSCSIRYMEDFLLQKGIPKSKTDLYIIGGSQIIGFDSKQGAVGAQNITVANEMLSGYKKVHRDVGGKVGRTIYFHTHTGELISRAHKGDSIYNNSLL